MMFRFNYMMLTVMTALSVLFLSSLTISSCDLWKTVLGGLGICPKSGTGLELNLIAVTLVQKEAIVDILRPCS